MKFHKIKALLKLGLEDLMKNMNVFIYILMPLGFAFFYSNINGLSKEYAFALCIILNLAMVPIALMGTIIAEEKEKNTLRTLMLNNVKPMEILFSKAMLCMMFVMINHVLIYFIIGLPKTTFIVYQLVALLTGFAIVFFGAFVGLLAKNQMSAGLLSMPFMLVFMAPLFGMMIENHTIHKIISFIPTDAMTTIFTNVTNHTMNISTVGLPFVVILSWMILSILLFYFTFKKVGIDNK